MQQIHISDEIIPRPRPSFQRSLAQLPCSRHNRPISARFCARVQVSFGNSPMTLLSHQDRRNARRIRNSAAIGLNKQSTLRIRQIRTKKETMRCRPSEASQHLRLASKLRPLRKRIRHDHICTGNRVVDGVKCFYTGQSVLSTFFSVSDFRIKQIGRYKRSYLVQSVHAPVIHRFGFG